MKLDGRWGDQYRQPENKPAPINNEELVTQFRAEGGSILHIRPSGNLRRGLTFAFKVKGRRIELATSFNHPNDAFAKKYGTKTAIEHFHAGKTILLPYKPDRGAHSSLKMIAFSLGMR